MTRTRRAHIPWSAEELAFVSENRTLALGELHAAFQSAFVRADVEPRDLHALRKRKGWKTGRDGRFEPGGVPANKGMKMPFNANSAATRFKPGHLGGRAAKVRQPIGAERLSAQGYLERKINDARPFYRRWRFVHLINWEAINGPVPEGQALKCLDGDRANTDPANWELIPRAMLPRLNGIHGRGYDAAPTELKPIIMTTTKLEHRARAARKGERR